MLGAKRADLILDQGDHEMLQTLAHQISVAVEQVETLEEIRRLNDNLERQVQERTQELSETLTELKEAQRQLVEAGMQSAVGRLVAALLHEVNTPLGTMISSVDMVERVLTRARNVLERVPGDGLDPDDPELLKALRALRETDKLTEVLGSSGQRIKDVLDSLARFVSLDAAEVRSLDLERSVRDAVELLSPSLSDRIKVEVDFTEKIQVRCYPARLNRVFLNLLNNAADAIPDRGEIRVRARLDGERVEILVEDTGCGIEPGQLEHLFELGFTTRASGRVSMRLGLPSSKRWVEELGGELSIESTEGEGTRVRVELPLTPNLPMPS
jgi:two-component system, NtrC family, sensor kinase